MFFFFKIFLFQPAIGVPLHFHMNSKISLQFLKKQKQNKTLENKKSSGILIGIALNM